MCKTMNEFERMVAERINLDSQIAVLTEQKKKLDAELQGYMKKRQKEELETDMARVFYKQVIKNVFDKKAFIENVRNGEKLINQYQRESPSMMFKITIAK